MLSSQDIKNKTFNRAIRGYNPEEVDSYIEFLGDKFEDLYRENRELEYKLKALTEQNAEKNEGDDIKQTLLLAQKAAERITSDAEKKAQLLYDSAKENTDKVLTEFREKIATEAIAYKKLKECVEELKESIYGIYRKNLEKIEEISPRCEGEASLCEPEIAEYIKMAVDGMKERISLSEQGEESEENAPYARREATDMPARKFRIVSVKDTIKELNKKMLDGTADISPDGEGGEDSGNEE